LNENLKHTSHFVGRWCFSSI